MSVRSITYLENLQYSCVNLNFSDAGLQYFAVLDDNGQDMVGLDIILACLTDLVLKKIIIFEKKKKKKFCIRTNIYFFLFKSVFLKMFYFILFISFLI